jgi:hypothetical protein
LIHIEIIFVVNVFSLRKFKKDNELCVKNYDWIMKILFSFEVQNKNVCFSEIYLSLNFWCIEKYVLRF